MGRAGPADHRGDFRTVVLGGEVIVPSSWLFEKVGFPCISDEEIAEMRHIEPVLKDEFGWYKKIKDQEKIAPKTQSFLWDAEPDSGEEFTFDVLNRTTVITQHYSSGFMKPSLAEVYSWILVYMPYHWRDVRFFCLDMNTAVRLPGSLNFYCQTQLLGGPRLWRGERYADDSCRLVRRD